MMKLKEFLELISIYENIQLMNAKTGKFYTDVTYLAGGSCSNINAIEAHETDVVHGVSVGLTKGEDPEPYLLITLDEVI